MKRRRKLQLLALTALTSSCQLLVGITERSSEDYVAASSGVTNLSGASGNGGSGSGSGGTAMNDAGAPSEGGNPPNGEGGTSSSRGGTTSSSGGGESGAADGISATLGGSSNGGAPSGGKSSSMGGKASMGGTTSSSGGQTSQGGVMQGSGGTPTTTACANGTGVGTSFLFSGYFFQNASVSNAHCISAKKAASGNAVGFELMVTGTVLRGNGEPGSYPSAGIGWASDGQFHGSYTVGVPANKFSQIPADVGFSGLGGGQYANTITLWLGGTSGAQSDVVELWVGGGTTSVLPVGDMKQTLTIAGVNWKLYAGVNLAQQTQVTYVRAQAADAASLDLLPFIEQALTGGYIATNRFVLGVQAGLQIWQVGNFEGKGVYSWQVDLSQHD